MDAKNKTISVDGNVVRWYVLVLPYGHRGSPSAGLRAELERREKSGEPPFDYFAPQYVEVRSVRGKMTKTTRALLFNYVFVHASEAEIYRMKSGTLRNYNFLPRVRESDRQHYPYLTDEAMENLRWVARAHETGQRPAVHKDARSHNAPPLAGGRHRRRPPCGAGDSQPVRPSRDAHADTPLQAILAAPTRLHGARQRR